MPEEPRTPVAVRIARPYSAEEDFLAHELETLTRTTVTLLGAQAKPQGVVLRFEVTLSSGEPLLRGEGRVVGFKPAKDGTLSALTLRFTRLDARSKALVDRAAAIRESRGRTSAPPPPSMADPAPPPVPPEPARGSRRPVPPEKHRPSVRAAPPPLPKPATEAPREPQAGSRPNPGRDQLLDRLRDRARALAPEAVAAILSAKRRR